MIGEDGLVDTILDFEAATDEARLYLDYGDILAANLGHLRQQSIPACFRALAKWQEIRQNLKKEEENDYNLNAKDVKAKTHLGQRCPSLTPSRQPLSYQ